MSKFWPTAYKSKSTPPFFSFPFMPQTQGKCCFATTIFTNTFATKVATVSAFNRSNGYGHGSSTSNLNRGRHPTCPIDNHETCSCPLSLFSACDLSWSPFLQQPLMTLSATQPTTLANLPRLASSSFLPPSKINLFLQPPFDIAL